MEQPSILKALNLLFGRVEGVVHVLPLGLAIPEKTDCLAPPEDNL